MNPKVAHTRHNQAWQKKQLAAGNCRVCGRPRRGNPRLCPRCTEKSRAYDKSRRPRNYG